MEHLVGEKELKSYCVAVFQKAGLLIDDADAIAEMLVHGDLRGVYSHGVCRTMEYVKRLLHNTASKIDSVKLISETPCTAVLDAGHALGAIASEKAVEIARKKAKEQGIAFVTVRNSNHYGMAAHWALKLAGEDMVGFSSSDSDPCLAPYGGASAYIGNNPFSYAVSGKKYKEICLDVACSMMAGGKKSRLIENGESLPSGSFLTADGRETTDPEKGVVALPFGGHKGSGLSFVMEILTSALGGGVFGAQMPGFMYLDQKNPTSHCFMAINIEAFRDLEEFKNHVDTYIDYIKQCPLMDGARKIFYPGEMEWQNKIKYRESGIPLSGGVVQDLISVGQMVGLNEDAYRFLVTED